MSSQNTIYNPKIHHRRSIRLQGYDYSQAGMYFITMCCQDRLCRFGRVVDGEMMLNEFGEIAYSEWVNLPERYPHISLDVFQIMPNHVHGIIIADMPVDDNAAATAAVGATLAVAQNAVAQYNTVTPNEMAGAINRAGASPAPTVAPTIGNIVGAYKSLVINGCLQICKSHNEYLGKLWQRNYYEQIIRDDKSYQIIAKYIINNPVKWNDDRYFNK
jgi:REP element-mobilizing transposase RayT